MVNSLLILAFISFLLSVVASLALSFFAKKITREITNILVAVHFLLLAAFLSTYSRTGSILFPSLTNYFILGSFCLGIITSGIILKTQYPTMLKMYFLLYIISIPLFIISPSRILGFIVTADINAMQRDRIHVTDNYFLIAQTDHRNFGANPLPYKLTREMGLFHRTLHRDIMLPGICDSVNVIQKMRDSINVRFFFSHNHAIDSLDQILVLTPVRDNRRIITRKPKTINNQ